MSQISAAYAGSLQSTEPAAIPSAANALILEAGLHKVVANTTLKADVLLMPGAQIEIAAGKSLTVLGDFRAPVARIFTGSGKVDMTRSSAPAAYPEWWGAVRDSPEVDCLPALRHCVAAHSVIELGAGDYHIADTWKIDVGHKRIWGAGKYGHAPREGTRVIVGAPDRDVIQVGFDKRPGGPNDFLQSVDLRWMELARRQPTVAAWADAANGAAGLRVRFVLNCHFEGLSASEHAIGYSVSGAVRSFFCDCEAFCSADGPGNYCGFHFDGRAEFGLAGGNASVYVVDSNTSAGGPARSRPGIGAFLQGAFADTYLINFETSAVSTGILVDGMAAQLDPGRRRTGHADLHIIMPVIDQYSRSAIELVDLSNYAMVDIVDPYAAAARGGFAALYWHRSLGLTSVTGGQFIGWGDAEGGGNAIGIYGLQAEGLGVSGTKLLGFRRPIGFEGCRDIDVVAAVNNPDQVATQAAVWLKDCDRGYLRVRIKGRKDAFPQGIYCAGRGNRRLTVDVTGIDPSCLTGGATNTVQLDRAPVSRNSDFDGNIIFGLPN